MKSNDIIRFRVTPEERARIQALADKTTRGNISSMIKNLLDRAIREEAAKTQRTETRYELKTASCEVRDRRQLVDGCCDDHPDPTTIATLQRTKPWRRFPNPTAPPATIRASTASRIGSPRRPGSKRSA